MSRKNFHIGNILDVGQRIKEVRGSLTQSEFGKMLGVKPPAISKYESGRIPDAETLKKIADYGGVSVDWLLKGDESEDQIKLSLRTEEYAFEAYDAIPVAPLDRLALQEAIAAVENYYRLHKLKRSVMQKARLITFVYEHCTENKEHPNDLLVEKYLPLAD